MVDGKCDEKTMFNSSLVVTHIVYRGAPPYEPLEGPYSSVANSLMTLSSEVLSCQIPISGFEKPFLHGKWKTENKYRFPQFPGKIPAIKYFLDTLIITAIVSLYCLQRGGKQKIVVGVDPLSCLPITLLKTIFGFKLIFYSVDFNRTRFKNKTLQYLYEKADELSSRFSDQTWVVCQSLKDHKKEKYRVDSIYIPNSSIFQSHFWENGEPFKVGNKMAWTGSFLTERQFDILFGLLSEIQKIRPDLEFYFAPMSRHEIFREYAHKYKLLKSEVLELHSRGEWQEFASRCDVGIAVYDNEFGSTEFIEPLKIWDFMMCGMPFIISCEPSISTPIKESGVAYFLEPGNKIPSGDSLKNFLDKENLRNLGKKCVTLAEEYDIRKQIEKTLRRLDD